MKITVKEAKKMEAESRGSRDLLDNDELTQKVQGIYENELNKLIDGADEKEKPYYQSVDYVLEDYIPNTVETIQKDMYKYVSGGEYAMPNNWRQINLDWDSDHKDGIKFSTLREKLLDGVNDADTEEFSQWGIDWFFKAFGTFGLKYNFREAVTDIVYNDMAEDGVLDESKKKEATGDSPQKIYRIKSLSTDVYEDDWEDGEGEHVNSWSGSDVLGRKMYKEFSSLGDILKMLNDEYLYIWKDADNIKNWAIFDDPDLKDEIRFDCDTTVDVDNSPADESDIESWKKGKKKLFNAHSVLYVTAEYTTYASAAELTEDAKKIGLDTI